MGALPVGYPALRASAEQLLDDVEALLGLSGGQVLDQLRSALRRPVTIAVSGRVNTGKSTLVNSLIGAKLAPTSSQETTSLVCRYAYGAPARAEAVLVSREAVPIPFSSTGPVVGNLSPETIDHLRVYVQAATLQLATIIDTPGLGSAVTDNALRSESLLLGESDSQNGADALLYLVRDTFRPDDKAFIASFRAHTGNAGTREPAPVIGLISHADNHGGGPWQSPEPVESAKVDASALASGMPQLATVLPVSGLLAETVRTGALREEDVRTLRGLRGADDIHLQFAEHLGPPEGVTVEDFRRLTALVGPYGIRYGRDFSRSAAELAGWLYERSGMSGLERALQTAVMAPAECARVQQTLEGLAAAARSHAWPPAVRGVIESARHAPAFHRLQEESALALLRESAPEHEFIAVLVGLRQPGWQPPSSGQTVREQNTYLELASHYQAKAGTAPTGAEARAARVIARSMLIRSREARASA